MSGTSADGIDIAIVEIAGEGYALRPRLLHHTSRAYPATLRDRILTLRRTGTTTLADITGLARDIALAYADAANAAIAAARLAPSDLTAIAAHGQTLYHAPPLTLQWIDPALLAARTGVDVITDFRRADCALGGQGAPLVPFADFLMFRHPEEGRVLLNLGGIANLTWLPAGCDVGQVLAFDTGPANCLSDSLCRAADPTGPGYDPGGRLALSGTVCEPGVEQALADPYFHRPPPRSTDTPAMLAIFARATAGRALSLPDQLATAAAIAGDAVWTSYERFCGGAPAHWIASGGGVNNQAILERLRRRVRSLTTADTHGVPSQAKEAIAFALLGAAFLDRTPASLPTVTGATRPAVLGSLTPRP